MKIQFGKLDLTYRESDNRLVDEWGSINTSESYDVIVCEFVSRGDFYPFSEASRDSLLKLFQGFRRLTSNKSKFYVFASDCRHDITQVCMDCLITSGFVHLSSFHGLYYYLIGFATNTKGSEDSVRCDAFTNQGNFLKFVFENVEAESVLHVQVSVTNITP